MWSCSEPQNPQNHGVVKVWWDEHFIGTYVCANTKYGPDVCDVKLVNWSNLFDIGYGPINFRDVIWSHTTMILRTSDVSTTRGYTVETDRNRHLNIVQIICCCCC